MSITHASQLKGERVEPIKVAFMLGSPSIQNKIAVKSILFGAFRSVFPNIQTNILAFWVSFSSIHKNVLSCENKCFLLRYRLFEAKKVRETAARRLLSILKRLKTAATFSKVTCFYPGVHEHTYEKRIQTIVFSVVLRAFDPFQDDRCVILNGKSR